MHWMPTKGIFFLVVTTHWILDPHCAPQSSLGRWYLVESQKGRWPMSCSKTSYLEIRDSSTAIRPYGSAITKRYFINVLEKLEKVHILHLIVYFECTQSKDIYCKDMPGTSQGILPGHESLAAPWDRSAHPGSSHHRKAGPKAPTLDVFVFHVFIECSSASSPFFQFLLVPTSRHRWSWERCQDHSDKLREWISMSTLTVAQRDPHRHGSLHKHVITCERSALLAVDHMFVVVLSEAPLNL